MLCVINTIISVFISLVFLFTSINVYPSCINPGYTLGFFNGVFNSYSQAYDSKNKVVELAPDTVKGAALNSQLFYNQTGCAINSDGTANKLTPGCLQDLAEVFVQRAHELDPSGVTENNYTLFWDSISTQHPLLTEIGGFSPSLLSMVNGLIATMGSFFGSMVKALAGTPPTVADEAGHIAALRTLVAQGQYVTLTAHSQGNLFLNVAYDAVIATAGTRGLNAVHIAPASTTLRGSYELSTSDTVIGLLSRTFRANLILPANPQDALGHALFETYLSTSLTGTFYSTQSTPYAVTQSLVSTALNGLDDPANNPICLPQPVICPNTFTQSQLGQIVIGTTIAQANAILGCTGSSPAAPAGFERQTYIWSNPQSLLDLNMDIAFASFTNGIFTAADTKSIVGPVFP
jgi:hypothetical protein